MKCKKKQKTNKWENPDFCLYSDDDPDHSHNLMGSKLGQGPSYDFFHTVPTSSIDIILLTGKVTVLK